ncbi:hypothetical protein HYH03_007110 [Edaphochlamys debaryana]|uniref:UBA domain-containing protein n=1 Tax=Edaphochlamys debaryana TaxID=47281 RepID=A0A835Y638_9CHLO|nr:hypothetical protein HYH03_007110 [Edaphochlamys debaryana]|eukprot:KAG2494871.1 hypothetical protein HYH03_007110 [Edaphochlamys debaryana]
MIVGGRTLQDDSKTLGEAGITATSRVLIARGSAGDPGAAASNAAADRAKRLERVRQAAEALAGRDARGLSDDYALDIEDQGGSTVAVKPEDRRNLVFGLVLHDKAKASMSKGDFATALEELLLAEEALLLCDPRLTGAVDNVPLLLIDLVWSAYKLGDLRRLAVSRERLARARQGLARAHGPNLERLRSLTGSTFCPELATYLRLEVLEGLVAYYGGEPRATAEAAFRAAQAKWQRLQVSDQALAMLQGMGYGLKESCRGLRFSGGDVSAAVDFIEEQRRQAEERSARRQRVNDWNHERTQYGKTAQGHYVDQGQFDKLVGMGFDRKLVGEALRKAENQGHMALDELSAPERRRALELELVLREGLKAGASGSGDAGTSAANGGGGGGPPPAAADAAADPKLEALKAAAAAMAEALAKPKPAEAADAGGAAGGVADMDADAAAAAAAAAAASSGSDSDHEMDPVEVARKAEVKEAESELVRHVVSNPMAAYDINVEEEGEIVAVFLTMLSTGAAAEAAEAAAAAAR